MIDLVEQIGLVAFALSAVLALRDHDVDIVGIVTLGVITAIGGGTVRDLLLDEPVFWVVDPAVLIVPSVASVVGFALVGPVVRAQRVVELLDGIGLGVFSVAGASIALDAGARPAIAVILGVATATAGGAIRDVLADRPTLLMGHGLYVTPALLGAGLHVTIIELDGATRLATALGAALAVGVRIPAVLWDLHMPAALTLRLRDDGAATETDTRG